MPVEATDPLTGIRVEVGEIEAGYRPVRCVSCGIVLFMWDATGEVEDLVKSTTEVCVAHAIRSAVCGRGEFVF